jgi:catechol 2,3-dioxygenase-like lactoylglutathione lyase family enzyme
MSVLRDIDATAVVAVKDVAAARLFYEETLGLRAPDDAGQDGTVAFTSGTTPIFVYESEFAGTNQANALVWDVGDDFDAILDDLRRKGVTFEHYDLPGLTLEATCMSPRTSKGCGSKTPTATSCTSTAAS